MTAKLNTDGSLDTTFNTTGIRIGGTGRTGVEIAGTQDGKIIVASNGQGPMAIYSYNSDGTLNDEFGIEGQFSQPFDNYLIRIAALKLLPDGKLLLAGRVYDSVLDKDKAVAARLNANGTIDTGFGNNGYKAFNITASSYGDYANDISVTTNGNIYVLCIKDDLDMNIKPYMAMLDSNGNAVPADASNKTIISFENTGRSYPTRLAVHNDGILISGAQIVAVNDTDEAYTSKMARYTIQTLAISGNSPDKVSAFPNPATELLYITGNSLLHKDYIIYTGTGQKALSGKFNQEIQSVNVSGLASGIYLLNIPESG